jgi:hypothetical protein
MKSKKLKNFLMRTETMQEYIYSSYSRLLKVPANECGKRRERKRIKWVWVRKEKIPSVHRQQRCLNGIPNKYVKRNWNLSGFT